MEEPSSAVLRSLEDLRSSSCAVSKFVATWDNLRSRLDFINSFMDFLSSRLDATAGTLRQSPPIKSHRAEPVESEEENHVTDNNPRSDEEEGSVDGSEPDDKPEPELKRKANATRDLESIFINFKPCRAAKQLRMYIIARIPSGVSQMYNEIPAILARAKDPAFTVLNGFGRLFKKRRKSFHRGASTESLDRQAAILALEFFLLSGCAVPRDRVRPPTRKHVERAVVKLKNRMLGEKGVDKAVSALGLLLMLASFGIPPQICNDDIATLFQLCDLKKKAGILRRSPILVPKVPEIIKGMVKDGKHFAAAKLIIAFELQEKFPLLPLLSSYLDAIKREAADEQKGQVSAKTMKEASRKLLFKLRSLANFLGDHDLSFGEYASFDLDAFISKVEKDASFDLDAFISKVEKDGVNLEETSQNQIAKENTEQIPPWIRSEARPKPLQNLNVKRKAEETAPSNRMETGPKLSPLLTGATSENAVALTMQQSRSLRRCSLEHQNFMSSPMNIQMSRGPPDTSLPNGAYLGINGTYPGILNHDPVLSADAEINSAATAGTDSLSGAYAGTGSRRPDFLNRDPATPAGNCTTGYLGNGLPPVGGGYGPPSAFPGSEPYDPYRDSFGSAGVPYDPHRHSFGSAGVPYDPHRDSFGSAGIPSTRFPFDLSRPSGASTGEYRGTYFSAGQNMTMQVPLPHATGSRTPGSANRYSFADMV